MRNKGFKHSNKTKEKMRKSAIGRVYSKEHNKNVSLAMKRIGHKPPSPLGRIWSEESRKKASKSHRGLRHTQESKIKIGMSSRIRNKGKNCSFWKGGISEYSYPEKWTYILKNAIRERDGYMCYECEIHQDELVGRYKKLSVHHIDYNKDNCNPDNLISLCHICHSKTNFNREYWTNYFIKELDLYDK